jgi:hypothetical protein
METDASGGRVRIDKAETGFLPVGISTTEGIKFSTLNRARNKK